MKSSPNRTPTASGPPPRARVTHQDREAEDDDRHREDPDGELIALVGRAAAAAHAGAPTSGRRRPLEAGRRSRPPGLADDDHPAGPLGEDGLQRLAVERRAVAVAQPHHDRARLHLAWPPRRSSARPGSAAPGGRARSPAAPPISFACSIFDWAAASCSSSGASSGRWLGHRDHRDHVDAAAPLRGELDRGRHRLLRERLVVLEGDQDAPVLDLLDAERLGQHHLDASRSATGPACAGRAGRR